ncbi:MAG: very short patch repair endonuclease [Candidatus Angelobacter sp.]
MDVLTPTQRRLNMSRIRGKDTKPERLIRSLLHSAGFRFRLHCSNLPGKPDIVLRKYKTVIFVNGCFWHGHGCSLSKLPETRVSFWKSKIEGTRFRDNCAWKELKALGWRSIIVWECALRGRRKLSSEVLSGRLSKLIRKPRAMYSALGHRQTA